MIAKNLSIIGSSKLREAAKKSYSLNGSAIKALKELNGAVGTFQQIKKKVPIKLFFP